MSYIILNRTPVTILNDRSFFFRRELSSLLDLYSNLYNFTTKCALSLFFGRWYLVWMSLATVEYPQPAGKILAQNTRAAQYGFRSKSCFAF